MTIPSAVMSREGFPGQYGLGIGNKGPKGNDLTEFLHGIQKGLRDRTEGRVKPLNQVIQDVGIK